AAIFLSAAMASSRLPSRMSACRARSGSLAAIFSLLGSKKWMQRDGLIGISRTGSGAPSASGLKKSRGLRMAPLCYAAAAAWCNLRAPSRRKRLVEERVGLPAGRIEVPPLRRQGLEALGHHRRLESLRVRAGGGAHTGRVAMRARAE